MSDLVEMGMEEGVHQLMERLSPEVAEVVRLDLIQKVGNALRFQARLQNELADLDSFVSAAVKQDSWGAW